jgi:CTP:molybdopterin cytidylyltransferase MocA
MSQKVDGRRIAAVILAAGRSTRMAGQNKYRGNLRAAAGADCG